MDKHILIRSMDELGRLYRCSIFVIRKKMRRMSRILLETFTIYINM